MFLTNTTIFFKKKKKKLVAHTPFQKQSSRAENCKLIKLKTTRKEILLLVKLQTCSSMPAILLTKKVLDTC